MSSKRCTYCDGTLDPTIERCPHCGTHRPTAKRTSGKPVLVSASQVHRPKGTCRGCGQRVSLGTAVCPSCRRRAPTRNLLRRLLPLAISLVPAVALAVAWQTGLLGGWLPPTALLESGLRSSEPHRPRDPPRIRSTRFDASCPTAAPVYLHAIDELPSAFLVLIAAPVADAPRVADSLAAHYRLQADGYESSARGFVIHEPPPDVIGRLLCEPAVSALEADAGISR